ncbi:MAG: retropepsin-like aspartic protease family protein, partial [Noviherbaspirillum sp.]
MIATANGQVPVYRVRLDTVRVGEIELTQVDATVQEQGLPFALLGMSFLNRTEMRRDGQHMTLTKRY